MRKKTPPTELKLRPIKRKQVQQFLAISASLAVMMSGCSDNSNQVTRRSTNTAGNSNVAVSSSQGEGDAVFYETAQQCRTDINQQNEEYQLLLKAYEAGTLSTKPTLPPMKAENCEAQIQAAKEAHEVNAPVYDSRFDCENAGYRCESTPVGYYTSGYRPVFGGTYFYYGSPDYVYIYRGSTRYQVYRPRTVYYSRDANRVVTSSGTSFSRSSPGRVKIPRQTTPNTSNLRSTTRPQGQAASGAVKGRGSNGFGSTYKSTGEGGK
jgi:hypothetical protein